MKTRLLIKTVLFCLFISGSVEGTSIMNQGFIPYIDSPPDSVYPASGLAIANHSEWTHSHYHQRIKEFKGNPLKKGDIIMLGNSLTEQGALWSDKFDNPKVRNRGIAGDTSDGILQRLGEVIWSQPTAVFLLIGTNDLWTSNTPQKTFDNINRVVTRIITGSPETKVYVQTVFPIQNQPKISEKIRKINQLLNSNQPDSKYEIIDTYSVLAGDDGNLTAEYTHDGVHLTEKGYEMWVNLLMDKIDN